MNTLLNSLLIVGVSSAAALAPMPRVPRTAVRMQADGPTGDAPAGEVAEAEPAPPKFSVKDLPGITAPLGFFDPIGFCSDATEGKIKFYRGECQKENSLFRCRAEPKSSQAWTFKSQSHLACLGRVCCRHPCSMCRVCLRNRLRGGQSQKRSQNR